jgi:hypothetical protein
MRLLSFAFTALAVYTIPVFAAFRPDLRKNVQVAELEPEQKVSSDATEIPLKAYPGSDFEIAFKCTDPTKQFTFTDCKTWVACCRPGQILLGDEATAFDCCEVDQELLGEKGTYQCCPSGLTYDECLGNLNETGTVCPDGELLVNEQCFCPPGTYRTDTGVCERLQCSSGLLSGKCYTFTFDNGFRYGYNSAGFYTASEESRVQQFGKFQLCADEGCSIITDLNPGDPFYIKDIHGSANGGQACKQWLNNASDGNHISKTPDFSQAGAFTITKWPCDKYCLSGFDAGIGPTCPTEMLGATFTTQDDQSCIPLTLLEVPCDVRSPANNCIWETKESQCDANQEGKDCKVPVVPAVTNSTTVPVSATTGDQPQIVLNTTVSVEASI